MTTAIMLVPLLAGIGLAVDYSRLASARGHMQQAVDAAALEAAKRILTSSAAATPSARRARARAMYNANLTNFHDATTSSFTVTETASSLTVTASGTVNLIFGRFLSESASSVKVQSTVPLGVADLEVALVLDNTGSMANSGKMTNLKIAAKNFITTIETAKANGALGNADIALVPFHAQVRVSTTNATASWLSFRVASPEPLLNVTSGSWQGCISDRDQPFDADIVAASGPMQKLYPAALCEYAGLSQVMPLSSNFDALRASIDAMAPTGNTNTTIGLAWGLNVLTKGMPLGDNASLPGGANSSKIILFLTDGTNTENRFSLVQADVDTRMAQLCNKARSTKIQIYTIRLMDGNEPLLKGCASSPSNYYSISDASQLDPLFKQIADQLIRLRISS